jgi:tetratricopeptide (TPR) repeat protein
VNARAYYMQGIGHKALGDESRAAECFRKALEQRNDHLWANYYLGMIR